MSQNAPARYHSLQITLHWLVVLLIFAVFIVGKLMSRLPNDDAKLLPLAVHMALGIAILIAMIVRIFARAKYSTPAHASTGNAFLDWLAKAVHLALYLFVFLMAISGVALSLQAGLTSIVFGRSGGALPQDFFDFTARALHGFIAPVLLGLIVLHIVGALYHQIVLKDDLMARMKREA